MQAVRRPLRRRRREIRELTARQAASPARDQRQNCPFGRSHGRGLDQEMLRVVRRRAMVEKRPAWPDTSAFRSLFVCRRTVGSRVAP